MRRFNEELGFLGDELPHANSSLTAQPSPLEQVDLIEIAPDIDSAISKKIEEKMLQLRREGSDSVLPELPEGLVPAESASLLDLGSLAGISIIEKPPDEAKQEEGGAEGEESPRHFDFGFMEEIKEVDEEEELLQALSARKEEERKKWEIEDAEEVATPLERIEEDEVSESETINLEWDEHFNKAQRFPRGSTRVGSQKQGLVKKNTLFQDKRRRYLRGRAADALGDGPLLQFEKLGVEQFTLAFHQQEGEVLLWLFLPCRRIHSQVASDIEIEKSRKALKELIAKRADVAEAHFGLGVVYVHLELYEEALAQFT